MLPGLGIDAHDRALLVKHVNIVFHVAATVRYVVDQKYTTTTATKATNLTFQLNIIILFVLLHRFDEKLKLALAINVCGTREILTLSREIENLKVSAYSLFGLLKLILRCIIEIYLMTSSIFVS